MASKMKRVNITRLRLDRKKAAWQWIQDNRPEQAALIESENFQKALAAFNGEVIIEMETKSR